MAGIIGPGGLLKYSLRPAVLTSAAKSANEKQAVIAALKRCATQNPFHLRLDCAAYLDRHGDALHNLADDLLRLLKFLEGRRVQGVDCDAVREDWDG